MALQDYSNLKLFVQSVPVTKAQDISFETVSGIIRVDTMTEGLSGFTDGVGHCAITAKSAVPLGGAEVDFQGICARKEFVTMQVTVGKTSYIGEGKFENVKYSQSTGASSEVDFSWLGELKALS